MQPTREQVRAAPKVLLHDHLDGGLRPQTVIDLAAEVGHELPARSAGALAAWFVTASSAGSLGGYLAPFAHTVPLLQSAAALTRVAREAVADLAADGVAYAEVRWAPELHLTDGLTADEAVAAVAAGLASETVVVRQILTAIRDGDHAVETARLAVAWRDRGVVGFDLAGDEAGHPAAGHAAALEMLREAGVRYTIHAGEAAGPDSVRDAVVCGASRLGHGVRLVEDAGLTSYVRDLGATLETCPTSNVQTGAVASLADHPGGRLDRLGLRVTVNTDNRLMSGTTLTDELLVAAGAFGWDLADLARISVTAAEASFLSWDERLDLVASVRDGWARVIEE